MVLFLPLLAGAALVGLLHMSAPDHWVTLCILGQKESWSRVKLVQYGAMTAGGHVSLSILLGLVIVVLGLAVSESLSHYVTVGTGVLMVFLGLGYGLRTLLVNVSVDYDREAQEKTEKVKVTGKRLAYFAVLGGTLSPDLSILPIFLISSQVSLGLVLDTAVVFAAASLLSLLILVLVGSVGLAKAFARAPAKYNDSLVGFVIAAVGLYVLLFG